MKNLLRVSLLHVLPAAHRPASKLPLPAADRAGGPGETTARSLARRLNPRIYATNFHEEAERRLTTMGLLVR